MLSNIVGTLLAFVAIMLMLSLLVTSLVQLTQATLRLRGRNLLVGVAALLKKHAVQAAPPSGKTSPLRKDPHLKLAAHVLNKAEASPKYLDTPNSTFRVLWGPPTSWVPPDDLARAVVSTLGPLAPANPQAAGPSAAAAGVAAPRAVAPAQGSVAEVQKTFENMEPAIAKRFQFIVRLWTVAWSFVIAFAFQLSTPDLLKTLPSQEAKRQAILAAVPSLTNEATRKLAFSTDDVLEESIGRLTKDFPEYAAVFDEVSGDKESKEVMMDEMRNVLGNRAKKEAVLSDYSSIIDTVSKGAATTAYDHTSHLIGQLDTFGISPKLNDLKFYFEMKPTAAVVAPKGPGGGGDALAPRAPCLEIHWARIVGVLITGILLSLGAPFWFVQLKNLSSLRDAMNPSAATTKQP